MIIQVAQLSATNLMETHVVQQSDNRDVANVVEIEFYLYNSYRLAVTVILSAQL